MSTPLHIAKTYDTGIGHIHERAAGWYLVTFYWQSGARVVQRWETSLERARYRLRALTEWRG